VCPGGVEVREQYTGDTGGENGLAWEGGESSVEEGGYDASEDGVQDVCSETAEAREAAAVGDDVADGGADGGCDGLLANEGDGRAGLEERLLLVGVFFVGGFVGGGRDGDSGGGGLDHAEGCDDLVEHVGCLVAWLVGGSSSDSLGVLVRGCGSTYEGDKHNRRPETQLQQHETPGRDLNTLSLAMLSSDSALDEGRSVRVRDRATSELKEEAHREPRLEVEPCKVFPVVVIE
jgi:hypothetical protein